MANNKALGVLGVIVLVAMGVGILVGMQLGGPAGPDPVATDADEGTSTSVPTTVPEQGGGGGTPTLPSSGRTTVPASEFDEGEVQSEVRRLVSIRRRASGLQGFPGGSATVNDIDSMANIHSQRMAREGIVSHEFNAMSSASRYRNQSLYDTCQFKSAADTYVIRADTISGNTLEVLAKSTAGRPYEVNGTTEINTNETEVARDIVGKWYNNSAYRERLSYVNAEYLGVGLEITEDGQVYATGNLC